MGAQKIGLENINCPKATESQLQIEDSKAIINKFWIIIIFCILLRLQKKTPKLERDLTEL
jgi:hypothetical protein